MKKFEEFKKLKSQGVPRLVIVDTLGISARTYDNYNNRHKTEQADDLQFKFPFDEKLYYKLVLNSQYLTKEDIALKLGISKKTLIEYEKNYIFPDFVRYLKLIGYSNDRIKNTLKIKSKEEVLSYLEKFVCIEKLISDILEFSEFVTFPISLCNPKEKDYIVENLFTISRMLMIYRDNIKKVNQSVENLR